MSKFIKIFPPVEAKRVEKYLNSSELKNILTKEDALIESDIMERIDYIIKCIRLSTSQSLGEWCYDSENSNPSKEHFGNFNKEQYRYMIRFKYSLPTIVEFRNFRYINSFPTSWLSEDFEQELEEEVKFHLQFL